MTVKRYTPTQCCEHDGTYVTYSDYQKLVAENAAISDRLQKLIQIVNNADNSYCMCGDSMESHVGGGCGSPTGMFDYHYNAWLESEKEAPLTDAFTAELRAQGLDAFAESVAEMHSKTEIGSHLEVQLAFTGDAAVLFAAQSARCEEGMKQAFVIVNFLDDPDSPSLVHIPCSVAGYSTLCGLDGGLGGDEMSSEEASIGTKISCPMCFEIWKVAKDVTASDFTRGATS